MNDSVQKLISYINNVINTPYKAALEVTEMPAELVELAATLKYFGDCVIETHAFAAAMAQGNMDGAIPPIGNRVANPLRILHSALKKMTSTAEEKLASELADINDKKSSIEKYNLFISSLIQYIPQQILVLGKYNGAVLLMNEMAIMEMYSDTDYIKKITTIMSKHTITEDMPEVEVVYPGIEGNKTLLVRSYELEWEGTSAVIYAISDISETKQLEIYAYHDSLTHLYNRTYGMKKLEEWVETKKHFVLLYADLDGLKRVNDEFGHNEGDAYIINAGKHLLAFPEKTIVCRLGGDEFMVLIPDISHEEVEKMAEQIATNLENDEYAADKDYTYGMSTGFVVVGVDNDLPVRNILANADEKMYQNKRARKAAKAAK